MTAELIRSRARDARRKTRRQLLGTLTGPVVGAFLYAFAILEFPRLPHLLHPLFAFALAWSLVGVYLLNRGMWSAEMPPDAGFTTGIEFCRREMERRSLLLRRVLLWSFGPVLLAIAIFIVALAVIGSKARGLLPNGLPFPALVAVWITGYFVQRVREQRELDREIAELNELERNNRP